MTPSAYRRQCWSDAARTIAICDVVVGAAYLLVVIGIKMNTGARLFDALLYGDIGKIGLISICLGTLFFAVALIFAPSAPAISTDSAAPTDPSS